MNISKLTNFTNVINGILKLIKNSRILKFFKIFKIRILNLCCHYCVSVLLTGGYWSQLYCNDEDYSPSENSFRHLHCVRLLLEPIHRRAAIWQLRQAPAARSPVRVDASTPACQSQLRNLRLDEPQFIRRFGCVSLGLLSSTSCCCWRYLTVTATTLSGRTGCNREVNVTRWLVAVNFTNCMNMTAAAARTSCKRHFPATWERQL